MRFTKYHENLNKHSNIELDLYAANIISSKQRYHFNPPRQSSMCTPTPSRAWVSFVNDKDLGLS